MEAVLLSVHLLVTIALVITILLQRSEGGALGMGGGPSGLISGRGAADFLNKSTRWLAFLFLANALALGWFAANRDDGTSVLDQAVEEEGETSLPSLPELPDDG